MLVARSIAFIAVFYSSRAFIGLVNERLYENYDLPSGFYTFSWISATAICGLTALFVAGLLEDLLPKSFINIPDDGRPIPVNTHFFICCLALAIFSLLIAPVHADFITPYVASFLDVPVR